MKRTGIAAAFAVGIAVGCAAAPVIEHAVTPAHAQNPSAKRWEQFCTYRADPMGRAGQWTDAANADMKEKGGAGWELVGVTNSAANFMYCFKRPAP